MIYPMDSIELTGLTAGHQGEFCRVFINNGDVYSGIYYGYAPSTSENPLLLQLAISREDAKRIGLPSVFDVVGIRYESITNVEFGGYE